jgi:hypothetical protein
MEELAIGCCLGPIPLAPLKRGDMSEEGNSTTQKQLLLLFLLLFLVPLFKGDLGGSGLAGKPIALPLHKGQAQAIVKRSVQQVFGIASFGSLFWFIGLP